MSFLAKLKIDGEEFNILDCKYGASQNSDENGMPSSRPNSGKIELLLESTIKLDFYEWSISNNATKNGEIIFYKRDNLSSFKTIEFTEAHCLKLLEHFNSDSGHPLQCSILISAKSIKVRGTSFTNNWPNKASLN